MKNRLTKKRRLVFALGGGGARGALQAGALRALLEAGIQPDLLVGTSVGAVNAIFLALRGFNPQSLNYLHDTWMAAAKADLLPANTAYLTIGLQWHNKVEYMVNMPLVNGTGLFLIDKAYFDALPAPHRETIRTVARHYMEKFVNVSRTENLKALGLLLGSGNIKAVDVPAGAAEEFARIGAVIRKNATSQIYDTGPFYDEALLARFNKILAEAGGTK